MWRPRDEATIVAAAERGDLEETHHFDAKRQLPPNGSKKGNRDLAGDVAAMAVDGGTIVYGVDEDAQGHPTRPTPISLAGQRERVDQIVQTLISEPPTIEIDAIPTSADPSLGYLVILVPPSPRAPHQVGGRYYGRAATGNRVLDEGDVSRLYRRREEWEAGVGELLDQEIVSSGYSPTRRLIYLHAVARPVAPQEEMLKVASGEERTDMMLASLSNAAARPEVFTPQVMSPDLAWTLAGWRRFGADSWWAGSEERERGDAAPAEGVLRMIIDLDGTAHLFGGRAGFSMDDGRLVFAERYVAGNITRFLAVLGSLYERAGYFGPVDVGVAVTGLQDAVSSAARWDSWPSPYPRPEYRRTRRLTAVELERAPRRASIELVGRLIEATAGVHYDPFADTQRR